MILPTRDRLRPGHRTMTFAARCIGSALFYHVRRVVLRRSKEQVRWPDAGWPIAAMQDPKAERDRTVEPLPHIAMGADVPAVHGYEPITKMRFSPSP